MTTQILNFSDEELTKVAREIQEGIPVLNHAIHVTAHQSGDDRKWQNIKEEEPLP